MYGAVPLHVAPGQAARDGEDWAFRMLAQFSEWSDEDPLLVYTDCSGTMGCAVDSSVALGAGNPRQHMWRYWWNGIGKRASVVKVAAHRSLAPATSDHEEWLIRGNAMADKWAKKGAALWSVSQDHIDFISGCERIVTDVVRWQSRCQEVFGELAQPYSEELAGTGHVVLDTELPQALIQACLEEGKAPFGDWSLADGGRNHLSCLDASASSSSSSSSSS